MNRLILASVLVAMTAWSVHAQSPEDVLALQVEVLSAWMEAEPEYSVCLQALEKLGGPSMFGVRDDTTYPRPSSSQMDALSSALASRFPGRIAPHCIVVDDGSPRSPLDLIRDRIARSAECDEVRDTHRERLSGAGSVEEVMALNRSLPSMAPCYPDTRRWIDPYGHAAAILQVTGPTFSSDSEASILFIPRRTSVGTRFRFCDYRRSSGAWDLVGECDALNVSH